jgi:starvation-inducible DNA-binding protein
MQLKDKDKNHEPAHQDVRTAADVHPENGREDCAVTDGLGRLLADSYRVSLKNQNLHWNVTGPQFSALHALFEEQYHELAGAIDVVAERMRALGVRAPGSFAEFSELASVNDSQGNPDAMEMCRELARDFKATSATAAALVTAAHAINDDGTADLATARVRVCDKAAWILDAHSG